MSLRWADYDPAEPEPEPVPPHSAFCEAHQKRYRGECPWCRAEAAGFTLEMPKHYMRGKDSRHGS